MNYNNNSLFYTDEPYSSFFVIHADTAADASSVQCASFMVDGIPPMCIDQISDEIRVCFIDCFIHLNFV